MNGTENVFNYLNYKDYLNETLHGKGATRGLQSQLARHLKCQSAYLYQVLKGKGELTEDQAYGITVFFQCSESAREYLMLLVRYSKAGSFELKNFLLVEIKRKQKEEFRLKNKSDASVDPELNQKAWDYYFSGLKPSLIHILTSSPHFQTIEQIHQKTNWSQIEIKSHLQNLSNFGFLIQKDSRWIYNSPSIHLSPESKHNNRLQVMRRSQAMMTLLENTSANQDTHFSSLFTLDKESYEKLKNQIAYFVEKAQKTIHAGGSDEVYILNLDLFQAIR